ncbi:hypothetical protein [Flavobacterium sp.]|nr:hypothetical protein [Flavobacterium sp.]
MNGIDRNSIFTDENPIISKNSIFGIKISLFDIEKRVFVDCNIIYMLL